MNNSNDLEQTLAALNRLMSNSTRRAADFDRLMEDVNLSKAKEMLEREKELRRYARHNKDLDAQRVRNIQRMDDEIELREKHLAELEQALKNSTKLERESQRKLNELKKRREKLEKDLEKAKYDVHKTQIEEELEQIKEEEEIHQARVDQHKKTTDEHNRLNQQLKTIRAEQARQTKELKEVSWSDVGASAKAKFSSAISSFAGKIFNPALFTAGMQGMIDDTRTNMSTQGDWLYGSMSKMKDIIELGIDPELYQELNSSHRRMILAVGGSNTQLEMLGETLPGIKKHFQSLPEANRHNMMLMQSLAEAGITPTIKSMNDVNGSLEKMSELTGKTIPALMTEINMFLSDSDIQASLRAMDEEQRRQYIEGISLRMKENVAMGISTERTLEMAKAMGKFGSETAHDRIRKGAQLQAAAGALGFTREEGELFNRIYTKADANRTDDEKALLQNLSIEMSRRLNELRGAGVVSELYSDKLIESLDLGGLVGKEGALSEPLTEQTMAIAPSLEEALGVYNDTQQEVPEWLRYIANVLDQLKALTSNNYVKALGGVVGGALSVKLIPALWKGTKNIFGKATDFIKGIGGRGGSKAATKGTATATAAAASNAGSKQAGKIIIEEAGEKTASTVAKKGIIKGGVKKIPIIGALAGLGFAAGRLWDGDYSGAAAEVVSGVASSFPGPGTAASVAIDAALIANDIRKLNDAENELPIVEPTSTQDEKTELPTVEPTRPQSAQDNKTELPTGEPTRPQSAQDKKTEPLPSANATQKVQHVKLADVAQTEKSANAQTEHRQQHEQLVDKLTSILEAISKLADLTIVSNTIGTSQNSNLTETVTNSKKLNELVLAIKEQIAPEEKMSTPDTMRHSAFGGNIQSYYNTVR